MKDSEAAAAKDGCNIERNASHHLQLFNSFSTLVNLNLAPLSLQYPSLTRYYYACLLPVLHSADY